MNVIVVGTDGSSTADDAVRQAAELAARLGAQLHLVTGYVPLHGVHVTGTPAGTDGTAWGVAPDVKARAILDKAAATARLQGASVTTHARKGDPADAILDVAEEERATLVVVGNRGMGSGRRWLLGNVPNKVSHHAGCTVLIARTV